MLPYGNNTNFSKLLAYMLPNHLYNFIIPRVLCNFVSKLYFCKVPFIFLLQSAGEQIKERLLCVSLQLGIIAVAVQEPSTGEEHFTHIVQALQLRYLQPRCINLYVSALNQLGLLWAERLEYNTAKTELIRSTEAYDKYKEVNPNMPPVPVHDLFLKVKQTLARSSCDQRDSSNVPTVADESIGEFTIIITIIFFPFLHIYIYIFFICFLDNQSFLLMLHIFVVII